MYVMKNILKSILLLLSSIRLIPHLIIFMVFDKKGYIKSDLMRWLKNPEAANSPVKTVLGFIRTMTYFPEFRSLFYYRAGWTSKLFKYLCPPMSTLFISAEEIGPGLFIQHGFSTIIVADRIGKNCWINQQVTIGYSNSDDCPTIGDNVVINAGAKVIGKVTIGDNSKVGANAVVVKNVPPNVTVVGVPAYIIKRDGKRVNERLVNN